MATDVCLWLTLLAVTIGFGGRMAMGQVALIIGTAATALCWLLHLLTTTEPRYVWTGSEWVWAGGVLVGAAQLIPLPREFLLKLSPKMAEILPLWFDSTATGVISTNWKQLSLAPWETAAAVAVFLSYAILFLVVAQRLRTIKDVEQMLCGVGLACIAMMLFAQIQFMTSNGKFFWVIDHPFMSTETYPLGCFTNRNHLAQFMALGIGPLVWWLLRRIQQQQLDRIERTGLPASLHAILVILLSAGLVGVALTALMTLSRGGFLAIGLAVLVSIGLMYRVGLLSWRFALAMLLVAAVTGSVFSFSKYEGILSTRLEQNTGRSEIWLANVKVARDFLFFGTGLGTHADAYRLHIDLPLDDGREYTHAESGYLQVASECGIAGLIVAALFILTGFWWCLGSLRNTESKVTSASAAVLASLVANVAHAVGDFFWYTPICMLILALQLACAARMYRITRQDAGRFVFSFSVPRLLSVAGMLVLIPLSVWMLDMRWGAALSEPHYFESVLLTKTDEQDLSEDEQRATEKQRIKEMLLAAKLNPRDSRMQELASEAYIQLFDLQQLDSENTMSLLMMRDAVRASDFESVDAANEWLNRATGSNAKSLRLAARALRRSVANCPLRAKAYVQMAELSFLDRRHDPKFEEECLMQSLRLRPYDPEIMYLVGKLAIQEGDLDKAMTYWKPAFQRSTRVQDRVARILAAQVSPEFFLTEFELNAMSMGVIANAFAISGRDTETRQMKSRFVREVMIEAKSQPSNEELELSLIAARNSCRDLDDIPAAAEVLSYAVKRFPQSYSVRYMLALDLIGSNRTADAAEHLKWCTNRRPDDINLRRMATQAVTERLKKTGPTATNDSKFPDGEHDRSFQ